MFSMWVANPQMLGADAEHIKYGSYDAVLKKEGNRWSIQILIGDDLCEVKLSGENDELPSKPRITLRFDRKSVGRLRLLLDRINDA